MTAGYGSIDWAEGLTGPPSFDGYGFTDDGLHFVLRQSWAGNADLCGGRVGLPLELGLPDQEPSEAMFAGTCAHWLIDTFIDLWQEGHMDLSVMQDPPYVEAKLIELAFTKEGMDLPSKFTSPRHMRQWVTELIFLLNAWVEDWLLVRDNHLLVEQAVGRENRLYMPLGTVKKPGQAEPVKVWVSGHPDLYTGDLLIDWKTSGRGWRKGKAFGMMQDDVYAGLIEWNEGFRIDKGLFVVGNRQTRAWEEHPTTITKASIEAAKVRGYAHAKALILGTYTFSPTGSFGTRHWPCRPEYCSAWDVCPARFIGDEYDNQTQITRSIYL